MEAPWGRRWWIGFGVRARRWERRNAAVDLVRRREAIPAASDGGCGEDWTGEALFRVLAG
jgi:hypothetical protein